MHHTFNRKKNLNGSPVFNKTGLRKEIIPYCDGEETDQGERTGEVKHRTELATHIVSGDF